MTIDAILLMAVSMLVLWGGLGAAIVNIVRFKGPEPDASMRDL
ncbi:MULTISPECIES: MetS family NSS transporter small subunit [Agrococcus]|nr:MULTISPECIES: MetS family NSS transporter small subunit [Agrococcus]QUW18426.1 MetS family NSS transporter small subunit [Agrococcus sp. Marseille-Q4369]